MGKIRPKVRIVRKKLKDLQKDDLVIYNRRIEGKFVGYNVFKVTKIGHTLLHCHRFVKIKLDDGIDIWYEPEDETFDVVEVYR